MFVMMDCGIANLRACIITVYGNVLPCNMNNYTDPTFEEGRTFSLQASFHFFKSIIMSNLSSEQLINP